MKTLNQILLKNLTQKISKKEIQRATDFRTPSKKSVTAFYNIHLQRWQTFINKETRKKFFPIQKEVIRRDAGKDPVELTVDFLLNWLDVVLNDPNFLEGIWRTAQKTTAVNFNKYDKGVYKRININGLPTGVEQQLIDNWIKSNVNLITKTNVNQVRALESLFRDNAYTGVRAKQLEEQIQKIFKGTRNNVALIARDQVAKLGGQLDRIKQTNAGIPGYYWRGARDERERLKHALREGNYYDWDKPPEGGHPGMEYQCRCDAEPAIDKAVMSNKEWKEERASEAKANASMKRQAVENAKKGPLNKPRKSKKTK